MLVKHVFIESYEYQATEQCVQVQYLVEVQNTPTSALVSSIAEQGWALRCG
jgi:hypothetical protein